MSLLASIAALQVSGAAENASVQLTKLRQIEELKALTALRQMPLDAESSIRIERAYQKLLDQIDPPKKPWYLTW